MVGEPLYTVFYGKSDSLAMGLFVFAVLQSTILGLYMVLSPMLQAMFRKLQGRSLFYLWFHCQAGLTTANHCSLSQLWTFDFHNHRPHYS